MEFKYYSIASGSKGNCGLFITPFGNILIDIGVSYKYLCESLKKHNIEMSSIKCLIITHEHSDHVRGLNMFLKKTPIQTFITRESYDALGIDALVNTYVAGDTFFVDDFFVESILTPHDSVQSVAYRIKCDDFVFCYATDLGYVTENLLNKLKGSDFVVLEANYDEFMLENGPYPYSLKKRIASNEGHLSNTDSANCVVSLLENGVKTVVLSHLSENNNTFTNVYDAIVNTARFYGVCAKFEDNIHIAPPKNDYPIIELERKDKCLI